MCTTGDSACSRKNNILFQKTVVKVYIIEVFLYHLPFSLTLHLEGLRKISGRFAKESELK